MNGAQPSWCRIDWEGCDLGFPGLGGQLYGVSGGAEGRGVGQVEVGDLGDAHLLVGCGGVGVDSLGDLVSQPAGELGAEQSAACGVAGDADGDR